MLLKVCPEQVRLREDKRIRRHSQTRVCVRARMSSSFVSIQTFLHECVKCQSQKTCSTFTVLVTHVCLCVFCFKSRIEYFVHVGSLGLQLRFEVNGRITFH